MTPPLGAPDAGPRAVVVVGASSGVGRATAHRLAERGDALVLVARGVTGLDDAAAECRSLGGADVLAVPGDVCDAAAMDQVAQAALARFGRIDGWVNCAGVIAYGRVEDVPPEVFRRVVETLVDGAAHCARSALPVFREQRHGTLVLVGSLLAEVVAPEMGPYTAGKWGVRALARVLRQEVRDAPGVEIALLAPGPVNTPIYRKAANYTGREGRPPAPTDSGERVARSVVRALDHPRPAVPIGLLNAVVRLGFTLTPWLYDALVGPLLHRVGMSARATPPTSGNVLASRPGDDDVSGGYPTMR